MGLNFHLLTKRHNEHRATVAVKHRQAVLGERGTSGDSSQGAMKLIFTGTRDLGGGIALSSGNGALNITLRQVLGKSNSQARAQGQGG
jgi:hypothetical protein